MTGAKTRVFTGLLVRRGIRTTAVVVMVALSVAAPAQAAPALTAPAQVANRPEPLLELSGDGIHYRTEKSLTVLEPHRGYVPGESRTGVIWVRNASSQANNFTLALANTGSGEDSAIASYLQLEARLPRWISSAAVPARSGGCTTIIEGWKIASGESLRIELSLALNINAPNSTRHQESLLDAIFLLQEPGGGQAVSACATQEEALGAGASIGRVPVSGRPGDSASAAAGTTQLFIQEEADLGPLWELAQWGQSNVVTTSRSPWPWLAILSAGTYVVISLRRQRRKRRTQ